MYSFDILHIKNNSDIKKYNSALDKKNRKNPFYSLQYFNYSSSETMICFLLNKNRAPIILLPIYLNKTKLPFLKIKDTYYDVKSPYGYSGPIINGPFCKNDIEFFWKKVDDWYLNNNVITEFIRFNLDFNHQFYSGHLIPSLENVVGELKAFNILWDNFKQKVRNNYRKAKNNNLKIEIKHNQKTKEDIDVFYDIYTDSMIRNKASAEYFYSKKYFKDFLTSFQKETILVFVYKDGKPISTELLIDYENSLYSFLGGTYSDFFEYRPNDFLKIEVIKWAIQNHKDKYILGGGRREKDGLYQYKKSFFPKDRDIMFYTGRKIINKELYDGLVQGLDPRNKNNINFIDPNIFFPIYKSP